MKELGKALVFAAVGAILALMFSANVADTGHLWAWRIAMIVLALGGCLWAWDAKEDRDEDETG